MSTKAKLLAVLENRRRNQEHNRSELAAEADYRRKARYSSEEFKRLAVTRAKEGAEKYAVEVVETDAMIALVTNHCPEEP